MFYLCYYGFISDAPLIVMFLYSIPLQINISFIKTCCVILGQLIWIHHIIHFLLFAVSGVVFPQRPHQNHRHQAHQEDHHHEGVKYGEPVNLSVKGNK